LLVLVQLQVWGKQDSKH